ncbi:hypothetical protein C8Q75DRAFT_608448 [Abortiporus biennis]|nr:hypothetical protein C8Q75DRAFT_608448 [Abortiporus biennis]
MVASTANRKKAKMTYAERVLGAMSQIQREHKKHSVHIATLRAQIRKNATERKEKLGPQWSNWVSKAVTKLEEQGVLENAGSGNVAFTNEAKKALTTARRESAAFPSLSFGPTILDDAAIKAFTQKNFSRGVKRPRYSGVSGISFRPGAQNDEGDDDDEPARSISVFSSPRRSQPKSKRARRSSIGGKVLSRMTRAELQAEVISLQEAALDNVEESAEATRLRLELESVKKQLTELENQRAAEVEPSELSDLSRLSTPEPGL